MKPRQLPSGAWNVRIMVQGQSYSFTDHDRRTALRLAADFAADNREKRQNPTFYDAMQQFIRERSETLSPSTIRAYSGISRMILERHPATARKKVTALTNMDVSNIVRPLRTVKTQRNYINFIQVATGKTFRVHLADAPPHEIAVPTDLEVAGLIALFRGTEMEIPVLLGAFGGLRRGEICALTMSDIDGNYINVSKSMVRTTAGDWIIKQPKTPKSIRRVMLPDFVISRILERGHITALEPWQVSDMFRKTQMRRGINPPYCFHSLRHYSASYLHAIGIPDAYILERGGWSTPHVMQKVYRHALSDRVDPMALKAVNSFQNTFQSVLN